MKHLTSFYPHFVQSYYAQGTKITQPSFFSMFIKYLSAEGLWKMCQMFPLPKRCKSLLTFEGTSGKGINSGWNVDFRNISGVKSFSVNLRTSCWICTNRYILNSMNNSFLQSSTCRVSSSGSIRQHRKIEKEYNFFRWSWWSVPETFKRLLLSQRWMHFGVLVTIVERRDQSILDMLGNLRFF